MSDNSLPWSIVQIDLHECFAPQTGRAIVDSTGRTICDNQTFYPQEVDPADMQIIVTAVNALPAALALAAAVETEDWQKIADALTAFRGDVLLRRDAS